MWYNEADTRAKLIEPGIRGRGWTEDHIRREETAGTVEIINGRGRRAGRGRVDYTLRIRVHSAAQPVAVALIEAKAEDRSPLHGLEQAKVYASTKRLNVPFAFSSNGHLFVEYDALTGLTTKPKPLSEFPTPEDLRTRYEAAKGFSLADPAAAALIVPYRGGEGTRRYYQDAAIRAVLEKIAAGGNRALLSLATGSGKTFIAVNLLRRVGDAGQLRRALFVCDRDELRSQGIGAFQNAFGADAAEVFEKPDGSNNAANARIHVATFQTLDVDKDDGTANFLTRHYPEGFFSHIVIDECHRSAWGKWSQVLTRNADGVHIGLTATPREIEGGTEEDRAITANNLKYFGPPVYEYDMAQGIEDGYLAACEVVRREIFIDDKAQSERVRGLERRDLVEKLLTDARTGAAVGIGEARDRYDASDFEGRLLIPERVVAMCYDLFNALIATGGPEQKTIVFCVRDRHADDVAATMNNLYAGWCLREGRARAEPYAFKCTAASGGSGMLPELRGASRSHFIATTVDLLTTGVDVPRVRNIVFFKYVRSPIAFYQMVGRGTRIDAATNKLMFRVYDYTDATRLFGERFITRVRVVRDPPPVGPDPPDPPERIIQVEGVEARVSDAGRLIVTHIDGRAMPIPVEDYEAQLAQKLVADAPSLDDFRRVWVDPEARRGMIADLPDAGRTLPLLRTLKEMDEFDLFDMLGELGYGMEPRTRSGRADAFGYKHDVWLDGLPPNAAKTVRALARQFARGGTEGLENPKVFQTPEVVAAGGLDALRTLGKPSDVLRETKERMFAA